MDGARPQGPTPGRARRALAWGVVGLGCAALAQWQFTLAHAARFAQWEDFLAHRSAGLVWYGAMALAVVGLAGALRGAPPLGCRRATRWAAALGLVVLVGAAAWLRFHRLEVLPPGLWVDEALNGVQAVEIAARGWPLVALPPEDVRTGLGAAFVNLAGLAFAWFDFSDGAWGVRAVAAVIGIAAVGAAAVLAWVWFGPLAAVATAGWLAVSQWHLNYSRWGEMPLMSSLVETLLALGVTAGLRGRGRRAWAGWLLAGAMAGAGLYTYQTFRLFIVLAAAAGALVAWRQRAALAGRGPAVAAAALLAVLVAAPMLHYAATRPVDFGERAAGTLIFGRDDWREQLAAAVPRSLFAFHLVGDDNPRHNLPFAPLLTPVPAALAAFGLVWCLTQAGRLPQGAVVLWLAIALVPGMITLEAPHASRLLDAIVPLALLIGVAVEVLGRVLWRALPAPAALPLLALGGVAAAAATVRAEWQAYFVARQRLPAFVDAFYPCESAPGRYLAARQPDATVYLDPVTLWQPATRFLAHRYLAAHPDRVRELRLAHDLPPSPVPARDALYLLPAPYASLAAVLRALSPDTVCETWRDGLDRVEMIACRVPQAALMRAARERWRSPYGLRGRYLAAAPAAPVREATLPFALLEYPLEEAPHGRLARAEWEGTIDLPHDGEYVFRLNPDSTTLEIAGRSILAHAGAAATGGANEARALLPAGRHPIRITLEPGPHGPAFLWFHWQPPGEPGGWVPATALRPPADHP